MRPVPAVHALLVAFAFATPSIASPGTGREAADTRTPDAAAVTREEVASLAAEITRLRVELAALRHEVEIMRGSAVPTLRAALPAETSFTGATSGVGAQAPPLPSMEMLRSQVDELSQTKVESASRMPVRLFGAIVSNTVSNSATANWLENPNLVDADLAGTEPGSFTSTLKQSHVGLNVGPLPVGAWTASAAVVADFFGGTPGFVTGTVFGLPRLVYAFARIENGGTAIEVGQDHNLLAPRDPTSLAAQSFPLLFRSGNLYLRSPQVRLEQKLGGVTLKGSIAAPIAADASSAYVFAPVAGAGERSQRPAFEGRADYTWGTPDTRSEFTVAVSARQGWRRPAATLDATTSLAADFNVRVGRVGLAGEFFSTDDAAEFGSAVAQPRPAQGGWIEGRLRISSKLSANGGVGRDRVDEPVPATARRENRSAFGNVIFDLTPEVAVSMEYRWLETSLGQALTSRTNNHVNAAFVVRF